MKKTFLFLILVSISYLSKANTLIGSDIESTQMSVDEASQVFDNWLFDDASNSFITTEQQLLMQVDCGASASGSLSCGMGFSACGSDAHDLSNQMIDMECFACGNQSACTTASIRDFGFWGWFFGNGY
jgi:hypothetical protein